MKGCHRHFHDMFYIHHFLYAEEDLGLRERETRTSIQRRSLGQMGFAPKIPPLPSACRLGDFFIDTNAFSRPKDGDISPFMV